MKRDDVIKQVAEAVGTRHSVDLTNYDLLIIVDIYRVLGNIAPGPIYQLIRAIANTSAEHFGDECGRERL